MLRPLKRVPAPVLALALALALAPGSTWALGLGGIRSDSALNEPFLGLIELNGIAPEELDAVQVTLAAEAEFTKVGSPRPHFLSRLAFTPEVSPEGRLQIRVTSPEPIREPYLDFLVEVTWPQGRLVKGYTVLLDPPTTLNRPPPAVKAPQFSAPGAGSSRSEDEPLRAGGAAPPSGISAVSGLPITPAIPTGASLAGAGQATNGIGPAPAAPPPVFGPSPPGYPLRYGPVPSGATLTTLARRMAPPRASREQTALAIFRANPHAFSGGDINRLKAGARLEISHPELIFALDAKTARQYYLAAQKGQGLPPLPGPTPAQAPAPEPLAVTSASAPDRLEIATRQPAVEDGSYPAAEEANGSPPVTPAPAPVPATSPATDLVSVPAHAASPATGMVTGVPPAVTSEGPLGPDLALVEREILLVREMAETGRQETTELRGRIDRLEAHLGDIKRLLELSNAHLAELQRLGVDARLGDEVRVAGEERVGGEGASIPSAPVPSAPEASSPPVAAEPVGSPVEQPSLRAREPIKPAPPPPPPAPEPSLFDDLSGWTLVVGGPLLVLLLGLLILVRRQNQVKPGPEAAPETLSASVPALVPDFGLDQSSIPPAASVTGPPAASDSAALPVKGRGLQAQLSRWRTRSSKWLRRSGGLKQRWSPQRISEAESPAKVGWLKRQLSRERPTATTIEVPAKQGWLQRQFTAWRTKKAESSADAGWRGQLPQWAARFRKAPPPAATAGAPTGTVGPLPPQALAALVPLAGPEPLEPIPSLGVESAQKREQPPAPQPQASLVAGETNSLENLAETWEVLSLPPLPGALDVGGSPSESPVKAAGTLAREVDQDIALEEAALAALDQTLRETEPAPTATQPLPSMPGELDLGDLLELPALAPAAAGPSLHPQPSAEVPELDLSDLEGLDLGEALGLAPIPSPSPPLVDTTGPMEGVSFGEMAGLAGPHPETSAAVSAQSGKPSADLGRELDLSDLLDLDLDLSVLSAPEAGSEPEPEPESAAAGLDLHPSQPSAETTSSWSPPSEKTSVEGEMGLALDFDQEPEIWDEVGIKLDLARAYLQMDDPEASHDILKEILIEGTEEQIAQAKALLARL